MSSVTFSTTVGGDGSTVTDDTSPTTGLDGGGHRTRFVPALAQVVAVAANTVDRAAAANGSANIATAAANTAAAQVTLAATAGAAQVTLATAQVAAAATQKALAEGHALASAASASTASAATATASAQAASAASAASAANTALLALGNAIANGVGAFSTDADGNLIGSYNTPTVTSMSINASGELLVVYP